MITNGTISEGIALQHCAVVFDPMSHIGTHAQQSGLVPHSGNWDAYIATVNLRVITETVCLDNVQYTSTARWRAEIYVTAPSRWSRAAISCELGRQFLSLLNQSPLRTVFGA